MSGSWPGSNYVGTWKVRHTGLIRNSGICGIRGIEIMHSRVCMCGCVGACTRVRMHSHKCRDSCISPLLLLYLRLGFAALLCHCIHRASWPASCPELTCLSHSAFHWCSGITDMDSLPGLRWVGGSEHWASHSHSKWFTLRAISPVYKSFIHLSYENIIAGLERWLCG